MTISASWKASTETSPTCDERNFRAGTPFPLRKRHGDIGFGWVLLWGSHLAIGPPTALALYLHAKAQHEERLFRARFPDYPDDAARAQVFREKLAAARRPCYLEKLR